MILWWLRNDNNLVYPLKSGRAVEKDGNKLECLCEYEILPKKLSYCFQIRPIECKHRQKCPELF